MWRIHLSPSYVYYYCATLFTKTGSIFYSSRFSHLQTLATQRLLNWCGQREWKCLHIVCLCWYVYFYVVKSGDFHCKQMSPQYKYIKTIYLSFLLLLPQNYILKFSFMLWYQNCKVSDVSSLSSSSCFLASTWFFLLFSSTFLLSFLAIFSILIPLFFSESIFFCSVFSCSKLIELFLPYLLLQLVSVAHLEGFFPPTLFVFYLQFVFIFLFIVFPLLLCSLFLILVLNKFILLSFYLFFLLLHNLLDFLLNLRRVIVTIKGQSKKNKAALHWHILTCRNFSPNFYINI